ncbi:MAG: glycosyltransferase family 10, partial [Desulfobacterales bacterium]
DVLVMLNNRMPCDVSVRCPPTNIWSLMQEPYQSGFTDWVIERHDVFARVFTHTPPSDSEKYVRSHPAVPWLVDKSYDELLFWPVPNKTDGISWIVGDAMDLPGHLKRREFYRAIRENPDLPVSVFGKSIRYIPDKWDGLAPYRYSLAIENSRGPDYWTEKVGDCFLSWTVPFYDGCTNLEAYFPEDAFVRIDIRDPSRAKARILETVSAEDWESRLPAIKEARNRLLNRYQFFPHLASLVRRYAKGAEAPATSVIPRYRRSTRARYNWLVYKVRKRLGRLGVL